MSRIFLAIAALALLGACGEKPQTVMYKQGHYRGKADAQAWDNPQFQNNRSVWEGAIKERNQRQNEYVRTRD